MENIYLPENIYGEIERDIDTIFGIADALTSIDANKALDEMDEEARDCLLHELFLRAENAHEIFHKNFNSEGFLKVKAPQVKRRKKN